LRHTEFRFLVRMPADAGGIEDDLRTAQRGHARAFRVPLIPADLYADFSVLGLEIREAKIAGCEVELLVVKRVVGNVHLAIFPEEAAVGVKHGAGVVIYAGCAALEKRSDDYDFSFLRDLRKRFCRGSGNRFGEIEKGSVFLAAEVFAAKQFVKRDDLRAAS